MGKIKEKTRTLMAQLEDGIGEKIPKGAAIIAWMVRWSAEFISKYSVGEDGKSPYERMRGNQCGTPLVPFGETVMYLPMKTVH